MLHTINQQEYSLDDGSVQTLLGNVQSSRVKSASDRKCMWYAMVKIRVYLPHIHCTCK